MVYTDGLIYILIGYNINNTYLVKIYINYIHWYYIIWYYK